MGTIKEKFDALPKESRTNIIVMMIIGLMFIVGIIVRWGYVSTEIKDSVNRYVEVFNPDSLKNK